MWTYQCCSSRRLRTCLCYIWQWLLNTCQYDSCCLSHFALPGVLARIKHQSPSIWSFKGGGERCWQYENDNIYFIYIIRHYVLLNAVALLQCYWCMWGWKGTGKYFEFNFWWLLWKCNYVDRLQSTSKDSLVHRAPKAYCSGIFLNK